MLKAQMSTVKSNSTSGIYEQRFFNLSEFNISEVKASSVLYSDETINPEYVIIKQNYSFCYLREDKLKLLDVYDRQGVKIEPRDFLKRFGLKIKSKNLFKTGKYLSRVFRPVKYGKFFKGLNVYVNNRMPVDYTDGISLISLRLAKELGWEDAQVNSSAQFTLFYKDGLVKGHCIVSEKIKSDIVVYGKENIKEEISFMLRDTAYVSVEPVKLSKSLKLDIQTMLNLWKMFGAEQYLLWASGGIMRFKRDLMSGKLNEWLIGKETDEEWVLKRAIAKGIDYRKYPGLFRSAWVMFRNSLERYAENIQGEPIFRIPVPCGMRAYIRIDLREHNSSGNFQIDTNNDNVIIDDLGNAWFGVKDFAKRLMILGGADQDDGIGVIPLGDKKAVIYRNPNQYGEYLITKAEILKQGKDCGVFNPTVKGSVEQKRINKSEQRTDTMTNHPNRLVEKFYREYPSRSEYKSKYVKYNKTNLLRAYVLVSGNISNIGYAANAEMVMSSIGIKDKALFKKMKTKYNWNLEAIIDGTVKEGSTADEEIEKIRAFLKEVEEEQIKLPATLINRLPQSMRANINKDEDEHELDMLLEAIKYIIEQADIEILGKGIASRGNRIPGLIDTLEVPVEKLALDDEENPMYSSAMTLLFEYNRSIAELLSRKESMKEDRLHSGIKAIQRNLLIRLNKYEHLQKLQIVNAIAYQIYKSDRSVHDSILWIKSEDGYTGTADLMIELLTINIKDETHPNSTCSVRLWSKEKIDIEELKGADIVDIVNNKCIIGSKELNIGDEHIGLVETGSYCINDIVSYRSKRTGRILKNSILIVIYNERIYNNRAN